MLCCCVGADAVQVQSKVDGPYKKELLNVYTEFCGNVEKRGNYIYYNPNDLLRVRLKLKEKQIEPVSVTVKLLTVEDPDCLCGWKCAGS